jgi:uncharacterized protein YceH (UPF0502 family)
VVDYDDHVVETTLGDLRERRLIRIVYSQSNRAAKYRHVLDEVLHLGDDELAVLAVLLLRGAQTAGEIKGRSERLHAFADLAAVNEVLDRLIGRYTGALVARLERQPGQKDVRYVQLLGDTGAATPAPLASAVAPSAPATVAGTEVAAAPPPEATPAPAGAPTDPALADRVTELEHQLAQLRAEFDALRSEFD